MRSLVLLLGLLALTSLARADGHEDMDDMDMDDHHDMMMGGDGEYWDISFNNFNGGGAGGHGGCYDDDDEFDEYLFDMIMHLAMPPTFLVSVEADFPPFNEPVRTNGVVTGFKGAALDIIEAAAYAGDFYVEFVMADWGLCIEDTDNDLYANWAIGEGLANDHFHACSAAGALPSRALSVGFSLGFAKQSDYVLVTTDDDVTLDSIETVIVVAGWATSSSFAAVQWGQDWDYVSVSRPVSNAIAELSTRIANNEQGVVAFLPESTIEGASLRVVDRATAPPVALMAKGGADVLYYFNYGLVHSMMDGSYEHVCEDWAEDGVECFDEEGFMMELEMHGFDLDEMMDDMDDMDMDW